MTYSSLAIGAAPLWRTIEQPPTLKLLVAALGLTFVVAELWWFLGPHGPGVVPAKERRAGSK